ncbi:hypothetical protein ACFRCW_45845 [Streptomyces sp. NPDC056653]|uniref:hypothetical protein n=1 Tax=Streptomyces sp. NPDC056653 TaxID=3345894 RepID=UPI0036A8C26B
MRWWVALGGEDGYEQRPDDVEQSLRAGVVDERGVPKAGVGQHARPQRPQPGLQGRSGQAASDDDGRGQANLDIT